MMGGLKRAFSKGSMKQLFGMKPKDKTSVLPSMYGAKGGGGGWTEVPVTDVGKEEKKDGGMFKWKTRRKSVEQLTEEKAVAATWNETLQMARYLGIDVEGKEGQAFRWIVEEALNAPLPDGWEEHKTAEEAVFYYHPVMKESTWEHPQDAYYKFMYLKMRKMRRARQNPAESDTREQRRKDRELVDLLWGMEKDQSKAKVLEQSETNAYCESWGRNDSESFPSLRALDPETEVPDEVKQVAEYLDIDLYSLSLPVSPDEVREIASYLGINVEREGHLLTLAKMCLLAPLPKGWEIYKDAQGNLFYFHRQTRKTSYRHPADEYFINRVLEDRARHNREVEEGRARRDLEEPWLDLHEQDGAVYWYNFRTRQRSDTRPAHLDPLPEEEEEEPHLQHPPAPPSSRETSMALSLPRKGAAPATLSRGPSVLSMSRASYGRRI